MRQNISASICLFTVKHLILYFGSSEQTGHTYFGSLFSVFRLLMLKKTLYNGIFFVPQFLSSVNNLLRGRREGNDFKLVSLIKEHIAAFLGRFITKVTAVTPETKQVHFVSSVWQNSLT